VIFCFVDIGEIVDHRCLNFLFIKHCTKNILKKKMPLTAFVKFVSGQGSCNSNTYQELKIKKYFK